MGSSERDEHDVVLNWDKDNSGNTGRDRGN